MWTALDVDVAEGLPLVSHFMCPLRLFQCIAMPPRDCRSYRTSCVHSVFLGRDCHAHHTSCTYHVDVADRLPLASHFLLPFHFVFFGGCRCRRCPMDCRSSRTLCAHIAFLCGRQCRRNIVTRLALLVPIPLFRWMTMPPRDCRSHHTSCVHSVFFGRDCHAKHTSCTYSAFFGGC